MEFAFLLYFMAFHGSTLALNLISFVALSRHMSKRILDDLPQTFSGFEPPISVLVPAYNEEQTIATSVHSLLQLNYSDFEILVINDGSSDRTLDVLINEFSLMELPKAIPSELPTKPVQAVYRSRVHHNLKVIDKENGGKADALNTGINCSSYALFCAVDADSILERDSLQRVAQPFVMDARTVASGGTVRVANGCEVLGGFLVKRGLPHNALALFQILEYLRAFLFGRMGWSPLNAMLIISGAFGLFRKETVVSAGGYSTKTVGEDMELIVRLHRHLRGSGEPYRIAFVPDPICWTQAPENLKALRSQRVRWQRGLSESLVTHFRLLFGRRGGVVGWIAFPYMVVFEWLEPVFTLMGYGFLAGASLSGSISPIATMEFLAAAIGLGIMVSTSALLLEEVSFHIYPKPKHVAVLFLIALAENFGYRQLNSLWRLTGLVKWVSRRKAVWGNMMRTELGKAAGPGVSVGTPEAVAEGG
jgi:cellulose synthase/poly-beta-1,6-N-acetylglucosamine synthase-like glycosyltransferase